MTTKRTKQQLESELQIAHARIALLSQEAVRMHEIVSVSKCLAAARELLAEQNGGKADAELLAAFISKLWWIDAKGEDLI